MVVLVILGFVAGSIAAAALVQGEVVTERGAVDVPYPAGDVKEVRVLGAVDVYVDGEPKPQFSVLGGMALLILATAAFMTFAALRFAAANPRLRTFWALAAAGLAVAGADELFAIHESAGHNLPFLADLPGIDRPDDVLLALYLPLAAAFVWWFRDVLRANRLTVVCMASAMLFFALTVVGDVASLRAEEWFELVAGLFVAAGLITLMHRHLKDNLHIRVRDRRPAARRGKPEAEPESAAEPALRR